MAEDVFWTMVSVVDREWFIYSIDCDLATAQEALREARLDYPDAIDWALVSLLRRGSKYSD